MRNFQFIFIILFSSFNSFSQGQEYLFPVNPGQRNYLSGSMGELRTTHFHGGIDIKTGGAIGWPIYAAADGYVSRIKVSPFGYGNALYIYHPNLGTTTVYGHLDKYEARIADYVRNEQYKRKSFDLDLSLTKEVFSVAKGDAEEQILGHLRNYKENELVVLGAYRRNELSRWFKVSMADTLMKELNTPLFIAPNK